VPRGKEEGTGVKREGNGEVVSPDARMGFNGAGGMEAGEEAAGHKPSVQAGGGSGRGAVMGEVPAHG
jgi:hypothetical protein